MAKAAPFIPLTEVAEMLEVNADEARYIVRFFGVETQVGERTSPKGKAPFVYNRAQVRLIIQAKKEFPSNG